MLYPDLYLINVSFAVNNVQLMREKYCQPDQPVLKNSNAK